MAYFLTAHLYYSVLTATQYKTMKRHCNESADSAKQAPTKLCGAFSSLFFPPSPLDWRTRGVVVVFQCTSKLDVFTVPDAP